MHFSESHVQMFSNRRFLTGACLLIAALSRGASGGEETRKSRSINDRSYQASRRTSRLNSLHSGDNDNRHAGSNYSIRSDYHGESIDEGNLKMIRDEERKLFDVIMSKDYRVSTPSEIEIFDRIGERMIARANLTEDAKRVVRQVKKQRPGFFWTLARVAFETVNETRSAIEQISILIGNNLAPETTTLTGRTSSSLTSKSTTTQRVPTTSEANSMDSMATTTTEKSSKLTRSELQSLIRRNLRGLVRLFNIEWQDALNQSQANVREFQRDLGKRISPFLQDNPDVV